jgi:glycosyltransferase involved in cell wall biosynthesis
MSKLLAVSPYVPYGGVPHAGGAYLLRHLEALRASYQISLFVPEFAHVRHDVSRAPEWLDVVVPDALARNDLRQQWLRLLRRLRFRSLRASTLRAFAEAGLFDRAREADLIELHWMDAAILAPALRRRRVTAPIVVVAYDVDLEAAPSVRRRFGSRVPRLVSLVGDRMRTFVSVRDLRASDLVLVFKESDVDLLRRRGLRTATRVQAPDVLLPEKLAVPDGRTVLFTGAMWRRENEDGISWFLRHAWPAVVAAVPAARFVIAGASPSSRLAREVRASTNVELTGEVADLAPYYQTATVFVAPLFVAGGLKFKVVQALAFGLPVVASTVAAAGLADAVPAAPLWCVTDDASRMADAIVVALRGPDDAAATGRLGAAWALDRWSFDRSMSDLGDEYRRLRSG